MYSGTMTQPDREYWRRMYAGMAMTGVLARVELEYDGRVNAPQVATMAFQIAGAMLKESEKKHE